MTILSNISDLAKNNPNHEYLWEKISIYFIFQPAKRQHCWIWKKLNDNLTESILLSSWPKYNIFHNFITIGFLFISENGFQHVQKRKCVTEIHSIVIIKNKPYSYMWMVNLDSISTKKTMLWWVIIVKRIEILLKPCIIPLFQPWTWGTWRGKVIVSWWD